MMGSHGTKAIAAALLGARSTLLDISPSNLEYAAAVAAAAGVELRLLCADVLHLPDSEHQGAAGGSSSSSSSASSSSSSASSSGSASSSSSASSSTPGPSNSRRTMAQCACTKHSFLPCCIPPLNDACVPPASAPHAAHDVILLELGVLHYFIDLAPLLAAAAAALAPNGILLLREFHPVSTKLLASAGRKHRVQGDYFDAAITTAPVAYSKYASDSSSSSSSYHGDRKVQLRRWTLGEVVTATARAGLLVRSLQEEPGVKRADAGLPKLFTLVASKPGPASANGISSVVY